MIFPSFSTILPVFLAFAVLSTNAAPLVGANANVKVTSDSSSSLDLVQTLKGVTDTLLGQVTSGAAVPGGLTSIGGLSILSQLTSALTSATGAAGSLPTIPTNPTSAVSSLSPLVTQILANVTAIVAKLSTVPLLGPLLAPVQGLLTSLLAALLPIAGGTLPTVPTLPTLPTSGILAGLIPGLGGLLPREVVAA